MCRIIISYTINLHSLRVNCVSVKLRKERHGVGAGKEERKEEYQESFLFHLDPYVTQTSQVLIEAK